MTTPNPTEQITLLPRQEIRPCPLNPRTTFLPTYLSELGLNIRENGLINALVLRPCRPTAEYPDAKWETIAGECRWRACGETKHPTSEVMMPAIEAIPSVVRDLPDSVVLALMLSENMQRKDLTDLEELDAFEKMLALVDEKGEKLYSRETLAAKIGVSEGYIRQRLSLRKLTSLGRFALASGGISFRVARAICACPESVVAKVEDWVLNPKKYMRWRQEPWALSAEETTEVIREHFVRDLSNAPFKPSGPDLVPVHVNEAGERMEGGACSDCPWNTANAPAEEEAPAAGAKGQGRPRGSSRHCLNPACFAKKVEVNISVELTKAKEQGARILSEAEVEKVMHENGALKHNTSYVRLDLKPETGDQARDIDSKKVPTWGKMVTGETTPEVVVAVADGKVFKLVERKEAIAAAKANGTAEKFLNLSSGRANSIQDDDAKEQRKKDAEKLKVRCAHVRAIMRNIVAVFKRSGVAEETDFWDGMLEVALGHAKQAGSVFVMRRREIPKGKDVRDAVRSFGLKLPDEERPAFVFELLLSEGFAWSESPHSSECYPRSVGALLKMFHIDVASVKREAEQELKAAKEAKGKGKKKAAPLAPAQSVEGPLPEGMTLSDDGEDGFVFNEHDVCTNPSVLILKFPKLSKLNASIRYARGPSGGWAACYSYALSNGAGSGPVNAARAKFATKWQAILEQAAALYEMLFGKGDGKKREAKMLAHYIGLLRILAQNEPPDTAPTPALEFQEEDKKRIEAIRHLRASNVAVTVATVQRSYKLSYQAACRLLDAAIDAEKEALRPAQPDGGKLLPGSDASEEDAGAGEADGAPKRKAPKKDLSSEARARIAEAQRARWAKKLAQKKKGGAK